MKVFGLDGKEYSFSLSPKTRGNASSLHLEARKILKELFPLEMIFEEQSLPGSNTQFNKILTVDFILPSKLLMIEIHGEQHYKYSSFFHTNKLEFAKAKARDKTKIEWAKLNNFILIELPYNKINEWKDIINNRGNYE